MKSKILYIDDEQENLEGFDYSFSDHYEVVTRRNPLDGFEVLDNEEIKVVVCDQRMPEMTGVEFLKKVSETWPNTIRVILTAYAEVENAKKAINQAEIYRYLTKPWKKSEIETTLKNAIELYDLRSKNTKLLNELVETNKKLTKANKTLAESETKYINIFEGIHDGIIYADIKGKIIEVNQRCCEIVGLKKEDLAGKNASTLARKFLNKKSVPYILNAITDNLAGNISNVIELGFNNRHLEIVTRLDKNIGVTGLIRDVTEQKKAQIALKDNQRILAQALKVGELGTWDWNIDTSETYWSEGLFKIYGRKQGDIPAVGKWAKKTVYHDDIKKLTTAIDDTIKKGKPYKIEYRIIKQDNNEVRIVQAEGELTKDKNGHRHLTGLVKDVTNERSYQQALMESEEKFRSIFEMSVDLICIADLNTETFLEVNPAFYRVLGYTEDELLNISFMKFVHPDDIDKTKAIIEKQLKMGDMIISFENRYLHKDGSCRIIEWNSHPVVEKGITYAIAHDVTGQREAKKALAESEIKYRGMFQNMANGVAVYESINNGKDFVFRDFNPGAEKITRIAKDKVLGKSLLESFPNMDKFGLFESLRKVYKTGKPIHLPAKYYKDKMREGWRENFIYKLPNGNVVAMLYDVTERMEALNDLKQSEERYKTLIESSPSIIFVIKEGKYTFANMATAKKLGYKNTKEIIGKPVFELFTPKYHASVAERLKKLKKFRSSEPCQVELFTKDGSILTLEAVFIKSSMNNEEVVLVIGHDVSLRIKHEKVRQAALKLNQMIFEYSIEDIMCEGLEYGEAITESNMGFFHFVNPDQETISLQVWSRDTMKICEVNEKDDHYPISKAGIWVDCFYTKKPVIFDDYQKNKQKSGLPRGHVSLKRILTIPVIEKNKVVAIVGVGNKDKSYEKSDVELLGIIADNIWSVIRRKRMEIELFESEQRYHTLSDMTTEGIMITKNMRLVDFNKAFERISGYKPDELKQKSLFDFTITKYEDEIMKRNQNDYSPPAEMEMRVKRGKLIQVEVEGHNIMYRGEKHRATAVRDLTERKLAQQKVVESERRFREMHENVSVISVMLDKKGNIIMINDFALKLSGWKREEVLGKNWFKVFVPREEGVFEVFKEIVEQGKLPVHFENHIKTKSGKLRLIAFTNTILRDEEGEIMGTASLGEDITDKREMERQILNAQIEAEERERKRFAEDLHDELGPFLAGIKLYINEISNEGITQAERVEVADLLKRMVDESVEKTRAISNSLMPNVLMDYGMIKAINSFANRIGETRFINIYFKPHNWEVRYDKTIEMLLYRVTIELINNTLKHANATNVHISVNEKNKILILTYTDNGKGFDLQKELKKEKGLGVRNMISRVNTVNGEYEFWSEKNKGIKLVLKIQLE